mgnify:CR=1 FL=1
MTSAGEEEEDEAAAPPSAATVAPGGGATPAPAADARLAAESERLLSQLTAQRQSPEFTKMLAFRKKLPSYSRRAELVAALRSSQVLVVSGETGCGKTTQVPQYVLEDCARRGGPLAALRGEQSQAKRVAVFRAVAARSGGAVLVATGVAARGLDDPDVDWVVQLDAPEDADAYVHRVGRAARNGRRGDPCDRNQPHQQGFRCPA